MLHVGNDREAQGSSYSHRALALHSLTMALPDQLDCSCHDTVLPAMSMFHANGWGFPLRSDHDGQQAGFAGRNLQPESLLDLLEGEQVTLTGGVPTIWLAVLNALDCHPGRWKLAPGLRIVVAGSAAPESMFRRFDKFGVRVIHLWGMTETTPFATVCTLKPHMANWTEDECYEQRAKQGFPSPFIEVRAVNDSREVPGMGATAGELEIRGPWVASSYFKARSERSLDQGWLVSYRRRGDD